MRAGALSQEGGGLSELLATEPELGDELNSTFTAAKSQPNDGADSVLHSTDEKFGEDATFLAERTIKLPNLMAGDSQMKSIPKSKISARRRN